jgi:arsenate reductase
MPLPQAELAPEATIAYYRSAMKLKVYEYENCSTCRKALKFLDRKEVAYERIPIVDRPPSLAELKRMLRAQNGQLRKLFNTSGLQYRELKLGDRLPQMSEAEALELLGANGKLIKRPFVLGENFEAVGFDEKAWSKAL